MPVTVCHHADLGVRVVIATDVVLARDPSEQKESIRIH
jgi:hypothetical protein